MKHINYTTTGVCSKQITLDIDDEGKIRNLKFIGGCPGNLQAISKILEGRDAKEAMSLLAGNTCGPRSTSCGDQLSKAISQAIKE